MERITTELVSQAKQILSTQSNRDISTQPTEISIYHGDVVSPEVMVRQQANMQAAFPKLDRPFFTLLTERLIANNFTEQRLRDAIGYLLDTFKYQTPNIADIINFDKKLKLYSHNEVIILIEDDKARFEDFHRHWIGDTMYRVKKTEVEMYGLERFLKKEK